QGDFLEDLLFTHRGLSGPAILQISSYWEPGAPIDVDLAPGLDLAASLVQAKAGARQQVGTALAQLWPRRLAEQWLAAMADRLHPGLAQMRLADAPDRALRVLGEGIARWRLVPSGTAGYRKAEVMRGGGDTRALNQKNHEARAVPGLHFIGEAADVSGGLGGYNFRAAWGSGVACGRAISPRPRDARRAIGHEKCCTRPPHSATAATVAGTPKRYKLFFASRLRSRRAGVEAVVQSQGGVRLNVHSRSPVRLAVRRAIAMLLTSLAALAVTVELWRYFGQAPSFVIDALLGGLVAAAATALGTLPVALSQRPSERTQDAMFGFGAGVMLAASAFSLVLPGIEA